MLQVNALTVQVGACRLTDVSLRVERGDYFVLLGESGVGKTVLLETIAGLISCQRGAIFLNGCEVTDEPIQCRSVGLVYQDHALFPHLTVRQNIAYPLRRRVPQKNAREMQIRVLAEQVGALQLLDRHPATLSQGEAQRIALARALASQPALLMLDEPLASLDVTAKADLRSLLRKLNYDGWTILHVTHDSEEAMALATKVAVMENGSISQTGTPDEVFHHPRSRFVAEFVGIRNFFQGSVRNEGSAVCFETNNFRAYLTPEIPACCGCLILKSEDIVLSLARPDGSARNCYPGLVVDLENFQRGVEVTVDIGIHLYALITRESAERLGIVRGKSLWVSFKATALQFIPEESLC